MVFAPRLQVLDRHRSAAQTLSQGRLWICYVASAVQEIHPTVVWAKLKSLAEGAQIATERLWASA
jgi:hypothetical protein